MHKPVWLQSGPRKKYDRHIIFEAYPFDPDQKQTEQEKKQSHAQRLIQT
jgi:hypothetical protein